MTPTGETGAINYGSIARIVDEVVDPLDEVGLVFWRAIDTNQFHAISINNEGRRFLNLKTPGQERVRVAIDLHDLELSRFLPGEISHYGLEYFAVETHRGREFDKEGFRPVCDREVETPAFRPYGLLRDLENGLTLSADGFVQKLYLQHAVQHQAVAASNNDGRIGTF